MEIASTPRKYKIPVRTHRATASGFFLAGVKSKIRRILEKPLVLMSKGFSVDGQEFIHHSELEPKETAVFNLTAGQKLVIFAGGIFLGAMLLINWHAVVQVLILLFTFIYFADVLFNVFLVYRAFTRRKEYVISKSEIMRMPAEQWPSYTIFCPLYREAEVVVQFVRAMKKLDYPEKKLQVLFLLEEDDKETVAKIRSLQLSPNFEIVVVPHSLPKTKPKAMNYGLQFVRGELVTIYDAEDVPDPLQLKKVVLAFKKAGAETVCIQSKLNFYNANQNLLTKLFTAEYSLWFDLILPGLQSLDAPIPLGGTSNHFRTADLRKLKGWDAFNVTEDCDLGIRLSKNGFQTAMVNSTTWEEANSELHNWYTQRSRWVKGYMQTFLVHMRHWREIIKNRRPRDLVFFLLVVGGKVVSIFINPVMWLMTFGYFAFRPYIGPAIESFFPAPVLYIAVFSFIFGNFFYMYNYMIGCAKRGFDGLIKYIFLVPLYWIGMSIAAWKGLVEMVVRPHYWAKTKHGLHLKFKENNSLLASGPAAVQPSAE